MSSFSDESEDSDDEDPPEPAVDHSSSRSGELEASEDKPLKHDPETVGQLRLIRQCRRPADIKERTATWVADRFAFGSPYILRMLQGDTPWPHWSRAQLFQACNRISSLFEQVELREKQARSLTKSLRKAMLASELKIKRDIRLFLHIARLGPSGGEEYRSMVTTERSRADFEATFSNPKAFKMFERVRQRVALDSPKRRSRRSFRSASNRGNRAYRQPRTTSTYRTQS